MKKIEIDFFEFMFLTEACIPPTPIARGYFWDKVCKEYYSGLSKEERKQAFKWISNHHLFNLENKDCRFFYDRYNPDNQYIVTYTYEGKTTTREAFLHEERYWVEFGAFIAPEYIEKVENITIWENITEKNKKLIEEWKDKPRESE